MKKMVVIILPLLLLASCHLRRERAFEKPLLLVSILPEKSFIEKIAGDDFRITVLIPPGANPSTYSLLPEQMKEIASAELWFRMGYVGVELSWADRIMEANPGMKTVDLSAGLPLMNSGHNGSNGGAGTDPHTWLSPGNVRMMAARIHDELILLRRENAEAYTLRYREFLQEIDSTDYKIREILHSCRNKKFISYHPSLSYFARDYGLIQLSIEQNGKEPTPSGMAQLTKAAIAEGIRVIYIQSEYDRELAKVVAEEINGSIVQIRPLDPGWSQNLIKIARLICDN